MNTPEHSWVDDILMGITDKELGFKADDRNFVNKLTNNETGYRLFKQDGFSKEMEVLFLPFICTAYPQSLPHGLLGSEAWNEWL